MFDHQMNVQYDGPGGHIRSFLNLVVTSNWVKLIYFILSVNYKIKQEANDGFL